MPNVTRRQFVRTAALAAAGTPLVASALRASTAITFDGDEQRDFMKGLGVRFSTPLRGPLHDR